MSEFDQLYDQVLTIVREVDLLPSFSQLASDRERVKAVLELAPLREYSVAFNFAGKSAAAAEGLLAQGDLAQDAWGSHSLYSAAVRAAPVGSTTLPRGYAARCALLRRQGAFRAALKDALMGLEESHCPETSVPLLQLAASCYQSLALWREAEDFNQQALAQLRVSTVSNETKAKLAMELVQSLKQTKLKEAPKINSTNSDEFEEREPSLLPELDYGVNEQMCCCSAAVRVGWAPDKGRHLVADRDIETGSVLIVEEPFAWSLSQEALSEHCLHCCRLVISAVPCLACSTVCFCSRSCRDEAWRSYHQLECSLLGHFLAEGRLSRMALVVYRILLTAGVTPAGMPPLFSQLHSAAPPPPPPAPCHDAEGRYAAVYQQVTNSESRSAGDLLQRAVSAVFLVRCLQRGWPGVGDGEGEVVLATAALRHLQSCSCNAYQMCEQRVEHGDVRNSLGAELGGAVYPSVSLSNHGCYPNLARHSYGKRCVVRALRSIRKGDELLDNYGPHFLSHSYEERAELLTSQYAFQCACQACTELWPTGDVLQKQITQYKCGHCGKNIGNSLIINCPHCKKKNLSSKKTQKQLQEMEKNYKNGVEGLLCGRVQGCLEICIRYARLLEIAVALPNKELVRCQQALASAWSLLANVRTGPPHRPTS